MTLQSPGVEITIIDQSQYLPAAAGPAPLIIAATSENKQNASNTGVATGTLASNSGKMQLVTSQRDLTTLFGVPAFNKVSGAVQQGSELNEYGLQAAYSFLGVSDAAYVMRPDIDLSSLTPLTSAPTGDVAVGTYWLDLTSSVWGLLEWNATDQSYSVITPTLITDGDNLSPSTNFPLATFGKAGDYAIVFVDNTGASATELKAYYKGVRTDLTNSNPWVLLGSSDWVESNPTIVTTQFVSSSTLSLQSETIGAQSIGTGVSASAFAGNINASSLNTVVFAVASGNSVYIYSTENLTVNGSPAVSGLGLTAGTYGRPYLQQSKHTVVPQFKTGSTPPRPTGSVWFKTSSPNNGANLVVKKYTSTGWVEVSTPLYSAGLATDGDNNDAALAALSADGVSASTIPANSLYMRYDNAGANTWRTELLKWNRTVPLTITSSTTISNPSSNPLTNSDFTVTINGVTYSITQASAGVDAMVVAFSSANIPNMQMVKNANNTITIKNLDGHDFYLTDGTNSPLAACNITDGLVTNWQDLTYSRASSEPTSTPTDGTLWYNSSFTDVDIMVNMLVMGTPTWQGYLNAYPSTDPKGPTVSASEPTTQSDGVTALATNDLWIDTSDLENFPVIKRYTTTGAWETVNNTDQTTENGVVFADARWNVDGSSTGSNSIVDLLSSDYVDLDAPMPAEYPTGMLLLNLRRSGYNVKEYKINYFNSTRFPNESLPSYTNTWVSKVTVDATGMPYMGRKSQRRVVVESMITMLSSSLDARKEQYTFNLIAAPGYPELAEAMVELNTDRKGTAFVLVDPPFRLAPTAQALTAWATNANGAIATGEDGLTLHDEYAAVYYPHGLTTDLNGNNVMVPPSHIMLRLIALNDQVAYPWFAPAGLRRGLVENASSVGYLDSQGDFQIALLGQGERDAMYINNLNPIVIQPTTGAIVVFGQKTLSSSTTALDRVNVARLVVYVRTQLDVLAKPFLFEPNDTVTRNQVKQKFESFLNELVAQRGLYDFLVVCDTSNNTPDRIDRNELWVDIAIKPVKAVEFIYIPIRLVNTGAALATV